MGSLLYTLKGHITSQTRIASKEPDSHPSRYYLSHTLLNFSDLTGTGLHKVMAYHLSFENKRTFCIGQIFPLNIVSESKVTDIQTDTWTD